MVPPGVNRLPLAAIHSSTLPATPGKSREGENLILHGMIDGDRQGAVPIHLGHLAEKIHPMIRPSLQNVELPLMNHFVRERIHDLLLAILTTLGGLSEQRKGEADFAIGRRAHTILFQPWTRPSMADKQAD
jgi:hypothetical protein